MNEKVLEALEEIKRSFKELSGIYSIALYGSAARGDFIPGWSDIDLLIVYDSDFVVPRKCYEDSISWYSNINSEMIRKYNFGIEISPHDKANLSYGKFCYVERTFKDHLRKSAKILYGEDIRGILSPIFPEGEEDSVAYSLWITRKNLISLGDQRTPQKLKESVKKCIGGFKNFLRNVCFLRTGYLEGDSNPEILSQFYSLFPKIDREKVEELMAVPYSWSSINDEKYLTELLFSSLNLRERIIESMIKENLFFKT